jgi:hypothetical protein
VLQDAVAGPLQPESFAYPSCDLFGVNRTFRLDDRKSKAADLRGTEIEEAAAIRNGKRAFPIFGADICASLDPVSYCPLVHEARSKSSP